MLIKMEYIKAMVAVAILRYEGFLSVLHKHFGNILGKIAVNWFKILQHIVNFDEKSGVFVL